MKNDLSNEILNSDKKSEKKFKYWAAISYPNDSEPENWRALALESGIECCSIYHDKDINETELTDPDAEGVIPQQGKFKKAHRHFIFAFPNTTTFNHANNLILKITNGIPVKGISNIKGAYAYLTHKYDPDKFQYLESDIDCLNGFAPENYFSINAGEEDEAFKSIEKIIKEQDFEEYCDLIDYLSANFVDLARFTRTHTIHIKEYLRSKHMKKRQAKKDKLLDLQIADYEFRLCQLHSCDVIDE